MLNNFQQSIRAARVSKRPQHSLTRVALKTFLLTLFCFISINAFALQKITLLLDWFPNPDHAPIFVAQQEGFFTKAGLEVTIIGPTNPSDPQKLVAAGKADIALTYEPQLLLDQQQGLPLVKIGTLINQPLGCLAVDAKSNIKSIKDLKGKTIGYSTEGVDILHIKTMLNSVGLNLNDVTLINVNYDLTQALMTHRVDAITGIMRNFEVIQMELAGFPVRTFYPENYGVPKYAELIFIANKNNAHFPEFLNAVQKGEIYLEKNPETSWEKFAKNHPELNNDLNKRAWLATLPYFTKNIAAIPAINPKK